MAASASPGNGKAAPQTALRGTLNTPKIVLLVIAAAAPLAAVVGTVPLAFALGNGVGVPGMFVFAGLVLLCFSVGYAAMSRRIVNAGGFYTYLSLGLGRSAAIGGGLVAVVSYNAASIGLIGAFGYFAQLTAAQHGLDLPWEVWAAAAILLTAYLGYCQIDLSAKVLAVLMIAEIAVLAVLDIAVIVSKGVHAVPIESLAPHNVFGGAVGVTMMFAFMSFIGFESAALYGEETKDPRRSIPLATYASVIVIAAFYALTSWVAVGGVGKDQLQEVAGQQLGDLFFQLSTTYVSSDLTTVMQILLCTSLLAASLALHNATNRYTFVLGRERVLPGWLGQPHPRFHSPHRAGLVQVVVSAIVVAAFAVAGLDPYTSLCTSLLGLGTLGIVVIQAAAAFSVIGFFRNRADRHWWRTLLAPLLGAAGLTTASLLLIEKFSLLTGTTNPVINALPWVLLIAAGGGVGYARWLKAGRPERYAAIAQVEIREDADVPVPMIVADRDPVPVA
ncbi:APC family permease [Jatrophihabitans lederbergiae]|uniref:APC family permease n=1 Tax=Jatrophihabitans lederbergiae TaxID=3075547 RepID=A0ABU2JAY2_9ACTN|nr:APC family permease [Jatrophihabitans sp. DSM 44399]MDT0262152.1 APC family permease [Jatrophihabitans sp. DSM 44399]